MTDGPAPEEEVDEGPSLEELRDFALDPDEGFVARVERSIQRRHTAAGLVDLSSTGFVAVFLEFVRMTVALFTGDQDHKEG